MGNSSEVLDDSMSTELNQQTDSTKRLEKLESNKLIIRRDSVVKSISRSDSQSCPFDEEMKTIQTQTQRVI